MFLKLRRINVLVVPFFCATRIQELASNNIRQTNDPTVLRISKRCRIVHIRVPDCVDDPTITIEVNKLIELNNAISMKEIFNIDFPCGTRLLKSFRKLLALSASSVTGAWSVSVHLVIVGLPAFSFNDINLATSRPVTFSAGHPDTRPG